MKCVTVYTNNLTELSDILPTLLTTQLEENEEKQIEGVTVSDAGDVPEDYIEKMKSKPEVAVLFTKNPPVTILQHNNVFELLFP
ncbi:hypothetical protein [Aneurinibacillus terranovensis]|uniref:hypothetical protein n=1 Tax=Aneurinibacillus terranovensis TaxID=278991 RepID=UPI0004122E47|nr:hypothetical protein [Aneurinibacillus terranovensis]